MIQGYQICSLFAGSGGIDYAFEMAGCRTIWANENDPDACKTYRLNFPEVHLAEEDIRSVSAKDIPDFEILTAGFPCQPFSCIGEERGFADSRGNLFFEIMRIVETKQPKAIFLENVANLVRHDKGNTFRIIRDELTARGYYFNYLVADAQEYGFPQRRNRVYIVCFKSKIANESFSFPSKIKLEKKISDIIDYSKRAPAWCYLQPGTKQYEKMDRAITSECELYRFSDDKFNKNGGILSSRDGVAFTLLAGMGNWRNREPIIRCKDGIRKLTPYECFMLQGYPDSFSLKGIPIRSAYRQAGNTVCVPVVALFAGKIVEALAGSNNSGMLPQARTVIGTVRDQRQLLTCLQEKFYHFPVRYLDGNLSDIENVALYVPKYISSGLSGIGYIGKVAKREILPRSRIMEIPKQSDEMYCKLNVVEWEIYNGNYKPVMNRAVLLAEPFV